MAHPLVASALLFGGVALLLVPDDPARVQDGKKGVTFDTLLERVALAAVGDAWQKPGWKDPILERGLADLVTQVQRATQHEGVKLPVAFGDVQPKGPAELRRPQQGGLCVLKGGSLAHLHRSILLVDGSVRVGFAKDCLIVARGAVEIAHGQRNVVLAGHYVHTSHDGDLRTGADGSLLMSGAVLDVSHSNGSVCSAPARVDVSFARGTTFVNSPTVNLSHDKGSRKVEGAKLPLAPAGRQHALQSKVKVTQVVPPNDAGQGALAVVDRDGAEVIVRPDVDIKGIPELAGWKLSFVARDFALFSRGPEDVGFHVKRPR